MITKLNSATFDGFEAIIVEIETSFTKGLPSFSIVGLASTTISESKDRVKSALSLNDFKFPPKRVTVNLSPSDIAKSGSHFDLPIALSIMLNGYDVDFSDFFIFGELGLDGNIKNTPFIFVLVLSLKQKYNLKKVLIPKEAVNQISLIPDIEIFAVSNLNEAVDFFTNDKNKYKISNQVFDYPFILINNKKYFYTKDFELDFSDVKGQQNAIEATLISVAGFHNILYEGSPGCGKSMISKRARYIMPPMSLEEILNNAKLDILNQKEPVFKPIRKFISPHQSSSKVSIIGGTTIGQIALANNGILFFDELPHFPKSVLEALREPLEDNYITISRVKQKVKYPTKFLFIAAMNPCPCGNLLSKKKECRCTDVEIQRYKNRLSEPFLDRIDLYVVMNESNFNDKAYYTSQELFEQVLKAFKRQFLRQNEFNGKLSEKDIQKYCKLDTQATNTLNLAISNFALSHRSINKILKVSQTIADLDESDIITKKHILKALNYRKR